MGEDTGFTIRDKRSSTQGSQGPVQGPIETEIPLKKSSSIGGSSPAEASRPQASHDPGHDSHSVQVTFSSFILSLAASGLAQLGGETDPASGKKSVNLAMARQTIDLLSLLQEKTKGNLTSEEESHLSQTLFALRMMFVDVGRTGGSG